MEILLLVPDVIFKSFRITDPSHHVPVTLQRFQSEIQNPEIF